MFPEDLRSFRLVYLCPHLCLAFDWEYDEGHRPYNFEMPESYMAGGIQK